MIIYNGSYEGKAPKRPKPSNPAVVILPQYNVRLKCPSEKGFRLPYFKTLTAALTAIALYNGIPFAKDIYAQTQQPPSPIVCETKEAINVTLPKKYLKRLSKYERMDVPEEILTMAMKIAYNESRFNPNAVGKAGEINLGQFLKGNKITDAFEHASVYSDSKIAKILKNYMGKGTIEEIVDATYERMRTDDIVGLDILIASVLKSEFVLRDLCSKAGITFDYTMLDALHNAHLRTLLSIARDKEGWKLCNMLPTITKLRQKELPRIHITNYPT